MHFALPPRKTSRPPPYVASRPVSSSSRRRGRLKVLLWTLGAVVFLVVLVSQFRSRKPRLKKDVIPPGTPPVVLVTVLEPALSLSTQKLLEQNRRQYAAKHNYGVFIVNSTDYELAASTKDTGIINPPVSWAKIPAMRHAMTNFPHSTFFFFLDQRTLIVNPTLSVERHIMDPSRLASIMIPNQPVVPPDSIIKTLNGRSAAHVDLVLTQDHEGLRQEVFIVRRGEWAKFFLDSWFDPLYRTYNFQRAEGHALEHLVQWHGTVLARMALIPQRIMNGYYVGLPDETYSQGDFIANLHRCDKSTERSCDEEARALFEEFENQLEDI